MQFEDALGEVKAGKGMRLPYWRPEIVVRCEMPDELSKVVASPSPYLYVDTDYGRVPWCETFPEMFNDKWEVVE